LGSGESLINRGNRKRNRLLYLGDKVPDFLGRRSVGAIHIPGKADDQTFNLVGLDEFRKGGRDLLGRLIFEEWEGGGESAGGIREGEAYTNSSVIDAEDAAHAE